MTASRDEGEITFTESGSVDVAQLDALHQLIGWDKHERRTDFYQRFGFQVVDTATLAPCGGEAQKQFTLRRRHQQC